MDAVSLAIVVTVLSLGSALIYLFKSDHERRQLANKQSLPTNSEIHLFHNSNNKKSSNSNHSNKPVRTHSTSANVVKQVPSSPLLIERNERIPIATQVTKQTTSNNAAKYSSSQEINHHLQQSLTASSKLLLQTIKGSKKQVLLSEQSEHESSQLNNMDPSLDELDSTVLMGVFSPPNAKSFTSNGTSKLASSRHNSKSSSFNSTPPLERKSLSRKKRISQEVMNNLNGSSNSSYSSEQLFNLIAASNLSKEEVEIAIETLLNKLESAADATWKQPKSDPLNRLKNQLRDSEAALSTEIQNHEHTRARLQELKMQVQNEKSLAKSNKEEIIRVNKELGVVNLALEQTRAELSKQQLLYKQFKEDTFQVISKHEQEKVQLQNMLSNASLKETELRDNLEEKESHLQRYELSNQTLNDKLQGYEGKNSQLELQLDQVRSSKHHDEYEAGVKISELESDGMRRDKALKDQNARLEELLDANNLLQKSVNELQIINGRQEEMLKRLKDERLINEASMKRTLCEMEQELKELQSKLSASTANSDEKLRKEMNQVERELCNVGQREQKLMSQIGQLKEGLSALLPNQKLVDFNPSFEAEDWVHQYLAAINQLARTVDDLRESLKASNNNNNIADSPSKKLVDKSTLTSHRNGAISPVSNGKSIKSDNLYDREGDKKLVETKLLEMTEYTKKLENDIKRLENDKNDSSNLEQYENQVKELKLQKTKLEAQIKFGLDSLKAEQQRVQVLEEELSKFVVESTPKAS